MWTVSFWKDTGERAVTTFAEVLIASVGVDAVANLGSWQTLLVTAGVAAGLSVLKSLAASRVGSRQDASLVK